MVIFEPLALTVPSGSAPARRKECAMVVRAYPSTSAGWQKMHRLEPLEALGSWRAEAFALPLPLMGLTDGLWPEETVARSARKPKSDSDSGCAAVARQARRTRRKRDPKPEFLIRSIRQREVLQSNALMPQGLLWSRESLAVDPPRSKARP